jgi:hypothetical protein
MKRIILFFAAIFILASCSSVKKSGSNKWISLWDGKTFTDWKFSEKPGTFSIVDGAIMVNGPRSHLYYVGPVANHEFKNFEFQAQVKTTAGSNSGIYFHTAYQDTNFPDKGFEVQVNNSHTDWKRTAGLYDIVDTKEVYVKDDVWFTETIIVQGKHVITKINDKVITDYTEPEGYVPLKSHPGRKIDKGTFAFQGHDPKSKVFFKDIKVRILPD